MEHTYKFKYRSPSFEIELETDDKDFLDSKISQIISENSLDFQNMETKRILKPSLTSSILDGEIDANDMNENEGDLIKINEIVNSITGSDNYDKICSEILDKSDSLNKILLCFYHINLKYPSKSTTTGTIQDITDQLGIKIDKSNIGTKIKSNLSLFTSDNVRKKGAKVYYKINRKGIQTLENLIK